MPPTPSITLPKALLAATQKVPDFQAKLEQFARTEVALHELRMSTAADAWLAKAAGSATTALTTAQIMAKTRGEA